MGWEDLFDTTQAAETKESTFEPITEGKYDGFIDSVKINETREPASTTITWKIVGDKESPFANRLVFSSYSMTETGISFLKKDMMLLGLTPKLATLRDDLQTLVGTEAEIYVKPRPVGDKTFYSVFINNVTTGRNIKKTAASDELNF